MVKSKKKDKPGLTPEQIQAKEQKREIGAAVRCNLSTLLGARRMTQRALANAVGLSTTTVNMLYHDKWGGIDRHNLAQLCRVLNCTIGELFEYKPDSIEPGD